MKIQIDETRLRELEDAEAKLMALEAGGVDNWEWYGEALEAYNKEIEEREQIQELYNEVEEAIGEGLEEPAGHGAGYGVRDEASKNALAILTDGIKKIIASRLDKGH